MVYTMCRERYLPPLSPAKITKNKQVNTSERWNNKRKESNSPSLQNAFLLEQGCHVHFAINCLLLSPMLDESPNPLLGSHSHMAFTPYRPDNFMALLLCGTPTIGEFKPTCPLQIYAVGNYRILGKRKSCKFWWCLHKVPF